MTLTAAVPLRAEDSRFHEALTLFNHQQYESSAAILEELTRGAPQNALYWFNLGNAQLLLGQYETALTSYGKVAELHSPLSTVASLYSAKAWRAANRPQKAADILASLSQQKLSPGLSQEVDVEWLGIDIDRLRQGMALYRAGQLSKAKAIFDRMVQDHPSADAYQMQGIVSLKLGNNEEASRDFRKVIEIGGDPRLQDDAHFFLKRIYEGSPSSSDYWLNAELGLGSNSNVESDGDVPIDRAMSELTLGAGYQFGRGKTFYLELADQLLWDEYWNLWNDRLVTEALQAELVYEHPELVARFGPTLQLETLGSTPFTSLWALDFLVQRNWENVEIGFRATAGQYSALNRSADYAAGDTESLRLFAETYGPNYYLTAYLLYTREDIGDIEPGDGTLIPAGNFSFGPGIAFSWLPLSELQLTTTLSYQNLRYFRPALPSQNLRVDHQLQGQIKVWCSLGGPLRIFASLSAIYNQSTLHGAPDPANKNYLEVISLIGLSWRILS